MTAATYNGPEDFFTTEGAFNVSFIMSLAHAQARAAITLAISVDAIDALGLKNHNGTPFSPRGKIYSRWHDEDAAFVASLAPELVRDIKARKSFPRYADALAKALADLWHKARVWKARGYAEKARAAAPVVTLKLAA